VIFEPPLRLPRGSAKSDDALAVAIGLVVEPGEDLRAPVAQGSDGDTDNVGDFLHCQQFIIGVRSDSAAAHWMLLMAYLLAGCRSRFARSDGCRSFSTRTLDRARWSMVRE
jgi:hypothetical protein